MSALDHEPEMVVYARKKAGLSQAQAAELLGHSPSYLSEIERGTRNARPALLLKMASVYNCPVVGLERKRAVA
jgi:transcriptional regulator with XRE-family HTH domain